MSDRAIKSSEEAQKIIKALTSAAVQLNYSEIVHELGEAETIGLSPDPYLGVPEVRPVTVTTVSFSFILFCHIATLLTLYQHISNKDGTPSEKTESEIPFNLDILRKHLSRFSIARRVLSEDLAARQKLVEDSVYDVAVQRMRRQAEVFKELGLGDSVLKKQDLQLWMWQWHQLLQARLKEGIALLIKKGQFTHFQLRYFAQLLPQNVLKVTGAGGLDPSCPSSHPKSSLLSPSLSLCACRVQVALQMA